MLNNADFVHLHCHSMFSRFDGLQQIDNMVRHARESNFPAIALTDHGNIGGLIKFYQQCKTQTMVDAKGEPLPIIKPIFGEEFYLARDLHRIGKDGNPDGRKGNRHLLLLAKNQDGYKNLCRLSQMSWTDGQYIDPRIDLNVLAEHSKGLICSSACLGSVVNYNLYTGRFQQAKKVATILKDIFGEDFYLSIMYHGIDAEGAICREIMRLGKMLGIDVVAENDAHYTRKDQARSQEVLMAMSSSRCIKDPRRIHFPHDEFYLKSAAEMELMFGSCPEVITNSVKIAERVEDFLQTGGMRLPDFGAAEVLKQRDRIILDPAVQAEIPLPRQHPQVQLIEELSWEGLKRLGWDKSPAHLEAYKKEMTDLGIAMTNNGMDFFSYFLIDWDIAEFAKAEGIARGCGRGSGYGSIVLRTLGITYGPDPLEYGLMWERFLAFDNNYFLLDSDWGFPEEGVKLDIDEIAENTDDFEGERATEDDLGGVDRY
jgi:DNA polymerase-3 subunit alpha